MQLSDGTTTTTAATTVSRDVHSAEVRIPHIETVKDGRADMAYNVLSSGGPEYCFGDDPMLVFPRQGVEFVSADEPSRAESTPRSGAAVALQLCVGNSTRECVGSRNDAGHEEMFASAMRLHKPHVPNCG